MDKIYFSGSYKPHSDNPYRVIVQFKTAEEEQRFIAVISGKSLEELEETNENEKKT